MRLTKRNLNWPEEPPFLIPEAALTHFREARAHGAQTEAAWNGRYSAYARAFPELAREPLAKQRILPNGDEVVRRAPDIILGSWCGKRFRPEKVAARPGWDTIPAVRHGELHEIKSPIILQPGPAALFDGLDEIHRIIAEWALR